MEKSEIIKNINTLRKEKNAIILSHFYQDGDIQDIADFIAIVLHWHNGRPKQQLILLFCVEFILWEKRQKIICPEKRVFIPDIKAGCSLADSCAVEEFQQFIDEHPDYTVISYINTSAAIKALSDIIVTSANAAKIIASLPEDENHFVPGQKFRRYVNKQTGRICFMEWRLSYTNNFLLNEFLN